MDYRENKMTHDAQAARDRTAKRKRVTTVVGCALTLVVAAPVTASEFWNPDTSRPGNDEPVSRSMEPVGAQATEVLGVLRRDQTAEDRNAGPQLKAVGMGNQADGIKLDAVRALPHGWALAPVDEVQVGPSKVARDQLCITNGSETGCSPASGAAAHGTAMSKVENRKSVFVGVVPDGVVRVRFVGLHGGRGEASVESNFYLLTVDTLAPPIMVAPPPESRDRTPIPGPQTPAPGDIQWLDETGAIVGPTP